MFYIKPLDHIFYSMLSVVMTHDYPDNGEGMPIQMDATSLKTTLQINV